MTTLQAPAPAPLGDGRGAAYVMTLTSSVAATSPPPAADSAPSASAEDPDAYSPPCYPSPHLALQPCPVIERIYPAELNAPGEEQGGVFYCHGLADPSFLKQLEEQMDTAVSDGGSYNMAADRRWFCSDEIASRLQQLLPASLAVTRVLPDLRFILYSGGGYIRPHVDGKRWDEQSARLSNSSFLFYLTMCEDSGCTRFLSSLGAASRPVAHVFPRANSLLLFPHDCPHEGDCVSGDAPKVRRGMQLLLA